MWHQWIKSIKHWSCKIRTKAKSNQCPTTSSNSPIDHISLISPWEHPCEMLGHGPLQSSLPPTHNKLRAFFSRKRHSHSLLRGDPVLDLVVRGYSVGLHSCISPKLIFKSKRDWEKKGDGDIGLWCSVQSKKNLKALDFLHALCWLRDQELYSSLSVVGWSVGCGGEWSHMHEEFYCVGHFVQYKL